MGRREPPIIRICLGQGFVDAGAITKIDVPNRWGGLGEVALRLAYGQFWSSESWISANKVGIHFGNVTKISTRNNLDETCEPWSLLWERPQGEFRYAYYFDAAQKLKEFVKKDHKR